MTLATAFASLATRVSAATGAPFFAGKLILAPGTPGHYDDDTGAWVPGGDPETADVMVQIDAMSEGTRAAAGFADKEYRFIILDGDFRDAIDTDASVKVVDDKAPADFRVAWAVSSLLRDSAGIGWTGKGRKA